MKKNEKEKMRMLGKSKMKKSYRGLCGVEVMGRKLRESVKRRFEFRTCRKSFLAQVGLTLRTLSCIL
jgi:hypothetical protein